jgi:hypothetical protein
MKNLLIVVLLFSFFFTACNQQKKTNWNLSYAKNSKEPFGCYIAYRHLSSMYPNASILGANDLVDAIKKLYKKPDYESKLAIAVCRDFHISGDDLILLNEFVESGQSVCILAEHFDDTFLHYFSLQSKDKEDLNFVTENKGPNTFVDSNKLCIDHRNTKYKFNYNGPSLLTTFADSCLQANNLMLKVMGQLGKNNAVNLIRIQKAGTLILGHTPLTMTNHFLLQDSNIAYYECLMSQFSSSFNQVCWVSKLVNQPANVNKNLFHLPPFFKAFLIVLTLLLLYTLFEGKRRQRQMEKRFPIENTSLEFIETVGRLYYNKGDHQNLSEKMIAYYFDNIRSKYNLNTQFQDEKFIQALSAKVNQSEVDTKAFIAYLIYIRQQQVLEEADILFLFQQLKKFL